MGAKNYVIVMYYVILYHLFSVYIKSSSTDLCVCVCVCVRVGICGGLSLSSLIAAHWLLVSSAVYLSLCVTPWTVLTL